MEFVGKGNLLLRGSHRRVLKKREGSEEKKGDRRHLGPRAKNRIHLCLLLATRTVAATPAAASRV